MKEKNSRKRNDEKMKPISNLISLMNLIGVMKSIENIFVHLFLILLISMLAFL